MTPIKIIITVEGGLVRQVITDDARTKREDAQPYEVTILDFDVSEIGTDEDEQELAERIAACGYPHSALEKSDNWEDTLNQHGLYIIY